MPSRILHIISICTIWLACILMSVVTESVQQSNDSANSSQGGVEILVTQSDALTLFACFLEQDDAPNTVAKPTTLCCEAIEAIIGALDPSSNDPSVSLTQTRTCPSEIATVPTSLPPQLKVANYVWQVSNNSDGFTSEKQLATVQYLFSATFNNGHDDSEALTSVTVLPMPDDANTSPFVMDAPVTDTLHISSQLGEDGGMHRLLHHHIRMSQQAVKSPFYVVLMIPTGMFVDLDDATTTSSIITSTMQSKNEASASRHSSSTHKSIDVEKWKIHSAKVCDIEQPSFVSEQYVIIIEVPAGLTVEFASKVHLRYPYPSSTKSGVDLMRPSMIAISRKGDALSSSLSTGGMLLTHIQVAAGNEDDYYFVMVTTLLACWVGVFLMMRDVSYISRWDKWDATGA